jgi:hypothetical protein
MADGRGMMGIGNNTETKQMAAIKWLVCAKCGKKDTTNKTVIPHYIGTAVTMCCPDCGIGTDKHTHALLCRTCCPTGHGTKWYD